jgi:hypothetical protein
VNHRRNLPLAERTLTPVRRVSWSQVVLGGAAAGTAALLAVVTPPVGSAWAGRVEGALMLTGSDPAQTATAEVGIAPGVPGPNSFTVRLAGFGNHRPITASGLRLRFEALDAGLLDAGLLDAADQAPADATGPRPGPASELPLAPAGPRGVYRARGPNLAADGRWRLTVVAPAGRSRFEIPLETVPRCATRALPAGSPSAAPGRSSGAIPAGVRGAIAGGSSGTAPAGFGGLAAQIALRIGSLQASLMPGLAGPNEIRAAFLDPAGRPLRLDSPPTVRISTTGHEPLALSDVVHPGPGEAAVTTGLAPGLWRVDIAGVAGGRPVRACFEAVLVARPHRGA